MIGAEKALVVLLKPAEARSSFRDWPDHVFLAICLLSSGDCHLVVFREEELDSFLPRLTRHLDIASDELCVVPRVAGHPSRRLLYTDEQRLRQIVAATPSIVDEALDYEANFNFAIEEGLDPAGLLGLDKVVVDIPAKPAGRITFAPAPVVPAQVVDVESKARSSVGLPKFITNQIDARLAPGPGFRSAVEIEEQEGANATYLLHAVNEGWVLIERCDGRGLGLRVSDPKQVFVSDDEKTLAFSLVPNWSWKGKLPGRLHISVQDLPWRILNLLETRTGEVTLSVDEHFVMVHLNRHVAVEKELVALEDELIVDEIPVIVDEIPAEIAPARMVGPSAPGLLRRFFGPRSRSEVGLIGSITVLILVGFTVLHFAPANADASSAAATGQVQK